MLGLSSYGISPISLPSYSGEVEVNVCQVYLSAYTPTTKLSSGIAVGEITLSVISPVLFTSDNAPSIERYIANLSAQIKHPVYMIEALRQDETVYDDISKHVIDGSGSVDADYADGLRRSSSFSIANPDGRYTEFINNLTMTSKYKVWLGVEIDGNAFYWPQGVFIFDDPNIDGHQDNKEVSLSGVDKWSLLNGQHGGILEGTYIVKAGSTYGDAIRRTLALDIVNDPVEPNIHPALEDEVITYDITKDEGGTIADIFLDMALNINANIYYDANGVLTSVPMEEEIFFGTEHIFDSSDTNYIGSVKQYDTENIYNSVLVVADNAQNEDEPIRCEVQNTDLADPNSIPNSMTKKVYIPSDYLEGIDSDKKALDRANYELRKIKNKYSNIDVDYIDVLYLDVGGIVQVHDDDISSNGDKYVINSTSRTIGTDIKSALSVAIVRDH